MTMEERVRLLEDKIEHQARQISKLFSEIDETKANIQKIMNILTQIRYFLYGGFAFFVATEIGFLQALKLM
jgi:N-glycosylase/DNA lyase